MQHGDERLDAVALALPQHAAVPLDALAVGFGVVAVGKDAAPAHRGAEELEAHLAKQRDILFIVVVEIVSSAERIELGAIVCKCGHQLIMAKGVVVVLLLDLVARPRAVEPAAILSRLAFAALIPGSVCLRARNRPAPQEIGIEAGLDLAHSSSLYVTSLSTPSIYEGF